MTKKPCGLLFFFLRVFSSDASVFTVLPKLRLLYDYLDNLKIMIGNQTNAMNGLKSIVIQLNDCMMKTSCWEGVGPRELSTP